MGTDVSTLLRHKLVLFQPRQPAWRRGLRLDLENQVLEPTGSGLTAASQSAAAVRRSCEDGCGYALWPLRLHPVLAAGEPPPNKTFRH